MIEILAHYYLETSDKVHITKINCDISDVIRVNFMGEFRFNHDFLNDVLREKIGENFDFGEFFVNFNDKWYRTFGIPELQLLLIMDENDFFKKD